MYADTRGPQLTDSSTHAPSTQLSQYHLSFLDDALRVREPVRNNVHDHILGRSDRRNRRRGGHDVVVDEVIVPFRTRVRRLECLIQRLREHMS